MAANRSEKLTPTQLALRALECAERNAKATTKLAEAVHVHAVEGAQFQGRVLEHMKNQDKVNASFQALATNELPHLVGSVGQLKGQFKIIIWALGLLTAAIIGTGIFNTIYS